jgi:hypothetical protein
MVVHHVLVQDDTVKALLWRICPQQLERRITCKHRMQLLPEP